MNKRYFQITNKFDPIIFIEKYKPIAYTLLDNGVDNFILGYTNKKSAITKIKKKKDFLKLETKTEYSFGYIPYEAKDLLLPQSNSKNKSIHSIDSPCFFFADGVVISKNNILLFYGTLEEYNHVIELNLRKNDSHKTPFLGKISRIKWTSKKKYLENVVQIKKKIQNGEIYEINYCQNFEFTNFNSNTFLIYQKLRNKTNAPFSSILNIGGITILSASPERFIKKSKSKLFSQPIKGTIQRGITKKEDISLIKRLTSDKKEIAENIMIVDLVRNDMSKIALKSSVEVTQLCKVYTFKTVHQLISTIQCNIDYNLSFLEILDALFPMGSMTGAPKLNATIIIEEFENFKREIYSGSIGYVSPNSSFDFNVVIRSIIISKENKILSISVGSAITSKSDPEQEYQECLLKLKAIQSALE